MWLCAHEKAQRSTAGCDTWKHVVVVIVVCIAIQTMIGYPRNSAQASM